MKLDSFTSACLFLLSAAAALAAEGRSFENGHAAAGVTPPKDSLPDSYNLLPAMLGQADAPRRDYLIVQSGTGDLAVHGGHWKYLPDLAVADGWKAKRKEPGAPDRPALFDLSKDPGETKNLIDDKLPEAQRLTDLLAQAKSRSVTRPQ